VAPRVQYPPRFPQQGIFFLVGCALSKICGSLQPTADWA